MNSLLKSFLLLLGLVLGINPVTAQTSESWTQLLDPKLSQWEKWMGAPHPSVEGLLAGIERSQHPKDGLPMGLNNDPKNVFRIVEENGQLVLYITGEIWGGLTTPKEYGDYHFSSEVKFGDKNYSPRENLKRDNGLK